MTVYGTVNFVPDVLYSHTNKKYVFELRAIQYTITSLKHNVKVVTSGGEKTSTKLEC